MKKRELKKANAGERNILYNRLGLQFSTDFLTFYKSYLYKTFPLMHAKDRLVEKFRCKIEGLMASKKDLLEDILFRNIDEPNNTESELYQNLFDNFDFDFHDFLF